MASGARVESVEAIRAFKATLFKFAGAAEVALSDADGEIRRTASWLETEQPAHWQRQVRRLQEAVSRAQEALRQKRIFKDSTGRPPSAVEEEKALAAARRRLADAQQKFDATRKWARRFQKEIELYRGTVARFANALALDVQTGAATLDKAVASLQAYLSLIATGGVAPVESAASGGMSFHTEGEALPDQRQPASPAAGDSADPQPKP